jgi:hypothetical protein
MERTTIEFRKLSIPVKYGSPIKNVYFVVENGRSIVMENFHELDRNTQEQIKALIGKMATIPNYQSPKIRYTLKGYNYGEIKPKPHRFFFFQYYGANIIFFDYLVKKRDSLDNETYQEINRKKERYEEVFRRYIQGR